MPIFRLPEFLLGVTAYLMMRKLPALSHRAPAIALVLLALTTAYLGFLGKLLPIYVGHNWIMIPLVGFSLIALFTKGGMLGGTIPVYLGKISYSFYCFQFHVIMFVILIMPGYSTHGVAFLASCFALLLAVSSISFHWWEEPARRFLRARYALQRSDRQ